jgi:hypothetical protein
MNLAVVRQLVWLDFRLAVIFTVILPLVLLVWSWRIGARPITRSLIIYWRIASLLAISVLLMIGSLPISFFSGIAARVLIPLSLWYWQDLNEEISQTRHQIGFYYQTWRWATVLYCAVGLVFNLVFANCGLLSPDNLYNTCKVWFEPPLLFQKIFLGGITTENILLAGIVGLIVYFLYFLVFLLVRLPKQGRIAFRE